MIPEHFDMIRKRYATFWWYVGRRGLFLRMLRRHGAGASPFGVDAGCGPATNEALHGELAARWLCSDIDRDSFSCWRPAGSKAACLADVRHLPVRGGRAGVLLLLDVLEHVEGEEQVLAEVGRVLAPGGMALLSVPAFPSLWSWHDLQAGHRKRYRLRELSSAGRAAGFEVVDARYFNCLLAVPIFLVRTVTRRMRSMERRIEAELSPGPLNGLLCRWLALENALAMAGLRCPWGTSAVVLLRKPFSPGGERP